MVTMEKCCEAVADILSNLYDSDFAGKYGYAPVDGLKDYAVDMAVNIFVLINDEETVTKVLETFEPEALKAEYFS